MPRAKGEEAGEQQQGGLLSGVRGTLGAAPSEDGCAYPVIDTRQQVASCCCLPLQECVHMVCRMGQLVARHCEKHKRLKVEESRETRTAMEKIDDLLLKVCARTLICGGTQRPPGCTWLAGRAHPLALNAWERLSSCMRVCRCCPARKSPTAWT